jgi:beta-lactamase class A
VTSPSSTQLRQQRIRTYKAARQQKQSPKLQDLPEAAPSSSTPEAPLESVVVPATPASRSPKILLLSLRLLISGIGLAAIAGTTISILHATAKLSQPRPTQAQDQAQAQVQSPIPALTPMQAALRKGKELTSVEQRIQGLAAAQPGLTPGMFFLNLDTGAYIDLGGGTRFPAASTIKSPILVAFFQDVDAGKIKLNEQLVMRPDLIAPESGVIQYQKPGTKFSALETADLMITISDNTATNMLIDRLGGAAALNQRFLSWGLTETAIRNWLPDLKGTNTTSPKDLATLMLLISQGEMLSVRSRDRLLDIMQRTVTNTLLPQGLGEGATIAHKTGDIGMAVGDAGMIDMPNGQRYVAAVMVKRPFNDSRAQELIRQISRLTYQSFDKPLPPVAGPKTIVPAGISAVQPQSNSPH